LIQNDVDGTWEVTGETRILIRPSEGYLTQMALNNQAQTDQELLDSLVPSGKELLMAEVEIQTITILMEANLI